MEGGLQVRLGPLRTWGALAGNWMEAGRGLGSARELMSAVVQRALRGRLLAGGLHWGGGGCATPYTQARRVGSRKRGHRKPAERLLAVPPSDLTALQEYREPGRTEGSAGGCRSLRYPGRGLLLLLLQPLVRRRGAIP